MRNYMRYEGPVLETQRLLLRELAPHDLDALSRVLSDAETMRYYPAPLTIAEVDQWITRNMARYAQDGHGLWGAVLKTTGELVGDCGLVRQQVEDASEIEIGYHLRRDLWNQGLASEAAGACRDYGFGRFPVERVICLVRPENLPSRRVAEKTGMTIDREVAWKGIPHLVYAVRREGRGPSL